ncbi:hypothetical protein KEM52_000307 [Ascosphaera acerosa]|nr:hypothetical protein KEM52_000307 [Ascosphaera acerosa]
MAALAGIEADVDLQRLDAATTSFFADWDALSTALATALLGLLGYAALLARDEDINPFFLARQASEAPVRRPRESAVYRSLATPHGVPLTRGLGIRDPGAKMHTAGRPGDLRDVWRAFTVGESGSGAAPVVKTVLGRFVTTHTAEEMTRQMCVLGRRFGGSGTGGGDGDGTRRTVLVCLSSSVELLVALFASSFFHFDIVLAPSDLPPDQLGHTAQAVRADTLLAEAGSLDLLAVLGAGRTLREVLWVTRGPGDGIDWAEAPDIARPLAIDTWAGIMGETVQGEDASLPPPEEASPPPVTLLWVKPDGQTELTTYEQQHLVAGTAGVLAALPTAHRLRATDTVLLADHPSQPYALATALAALFTRAALALGPVAGSRVNLALASETCAPSVVVAGAPAVADFYTEYLLPASRGVLGLGALAACLRRVALGRGVFPPRLGARGLAGSVRVLLVAQRADAAAGATGATGAARPAVDCAMMAGLRALLGVRVAVALAAPGVFGAVSQTNLLDYRVPRGVGAHFGPPVSSVEVKVVQGGRGAEDETRDRVMEGSIHVAGPAVVGGHRDLGVQGRINPDYTLSLA